MRWVLFIFSLVVFALANYFAGVAGQNTGQETPDSVQNLFDFWLLTFALVTVDTGYRLLKSPFIFFPLGYLAVVVIRYFDLPFDALYQLLGSGLHLVLGVWFLVLFFRVPKKDSEIRAFLLATGLAAAFFGTNLVSFFGEFPSWEQVHSFRLSSYLIVATAGRFLLMEQPPHDYPQLARLMPLVIIIHLYLIAGKIIENFIV